MLLKRFLIFFTLSTFISCSNNETIKNILRAKNMQYANPPKLSLFHNVEKLRKIIVSVSDQVVTEWKLSKFANGSENWYCHTTLTQFGKVSENGFQNDLHFVLLGNQSSSINEVNIILNIKNEKDVDNAKQMLLLYTNQLFIRLGLIYPKELPQRITYGEEFYFEDDSCYMYLFQEQEKEFNNNIHSTIYTGLFLRRSLFNTHFRNPCLNSSSHTAQFIHLLHENFCSFN